MGIWLLVWLLLGAVAGRAGVDPRGYLHNVVGRGEPLLLKVWVQQGDELLLSSDYDLVYSMEQPEIAQNLTLPLTNLTHNLTLYASLFKLSPQLEEIAHESKNLTRFQKKRKDEQSAFGGSYDPIDEIASTSKNESETPAEYGMHVAVDFNVIVIYSDMPIPKGQQLPPNLGVRTLPTRSPEGLSFYTVGIDLSQMHIPFRSYLPLPTPNSSHDCTLHVFPYSITRYAMFYQLGNPSAMMSQLGPLGAMLEADEGMLDELKEVLFTNHVYLVAAYFLLSLAQTVLRFFTIRQEYRFWKDIENNRGVTLKTLFYELVFSAVLTLYVYEHNSSRLVVIFSLIDIAVTLWKITRTFTIRVSRAWPWVRLEASELYRQREKLDGEAVWYMNYLLAPLMAGYLWWALHRRGYAVREWYPFLLETAVAFIAVFGFIMMTPQLYLNYRLKSVDHLNWRGLVYRFINTLLDDLFAFMVTMPLLRRLMYFRDDVIFLAYLYQRRIYRVDPTRRAPECDLPEPTDPSSSSSLKRE